MEDRLTFDQVEQALCSEKWAFHVRGMEKITKEWNKRSGGKLSPEKFLDIVSQEMKLVRCRMEEEEQYQSCGATEGLGWHNLFLERMFRFCGYTLMEAAEPWVSEGAMELGGAWPHFQIVAHSGGLVLCHPGRMAFHELGHALTCRPADGRGAGWNSTSLTPHANGPRAEKRALQTEAQASSMESLLLCLVALGDAKALFRSTKAPVELVSSSPLRAFVVKESRDTQAPWVHREMDQHVDRWQSVLAFLYLYAAYLDGSPLLARCLWALGLSGASNEDHSTGEDVVVRDPSLQGGMRLVGNYRWAWPQALDRGVSSPPMTLKRALPPPVYQVFLSGEEWDTFIDRTCVDAWWRGSAKDRQPFAFRACYQYTGSPLLNHPWG
jgi:hypothetical protein